MIILLEGPDGSGKSTLAKTLSEQCNMDIIHNKAPTDAFDMYSMYREIVLDRDNVIVDRCWYSEMVYGPIMRNGSAISYRDMLYLEELITHNQGGLIIHCTDTIALLWNRCQARGEEHILDVSTLSKIKLEYESLMHNTKHLLPVVRYELSKGMPKL